MTIAFQQYAFAIKRQFSVQYTRSIIFRRHILKKMKFFKLNSFFFRNFKSNQIKQTVCSVLFTAFAGNMPRLSPMWPVQKPSAAKKN